MNCEMRLQVRSLGRNIKSSLKAIVNPDDFHLEYLEEHKKRVERMKEGDYVNASDLKYLLEES